MKIIIIKKNNTDKPSFTASVFKTDLVSHSSTEIKALESLIKQIKERDEKWILSNDHLKEE